MLSPYQDRVLVVELDANEPVSADVDIALYDSFAQPESDHDVVAVLGCRQTEEFQGQGDPDVLRDFLTVFSATARTARSQGHTLYCWVCV